MNAGCTGLGWAGKTRENLSSFTYSTRESILGFLCPFIRVLPSAPAVILGVI
jgi:hypothetical protein